MNIRPPDFLVIGGMKCASTGIYYDLSQNPEIFLSDDKELNFFIKDSSVLKKDFASYLLNFKNTTEQQMVGEVSTTYSMLPTYKDVPVKARELLGQDLKIIYSIRNPLKRLISHYQHEVIRGVYTEEFDVAIMRYSEMLEYTQYGLQIEPWLYEFGRKNIQIVFFENYVDDRSKTIDEICLFLGVASNSKQLNLDLTMNSTQGKPVPSKVWLAVSNNHIYRNYLRPYTSFSFRNKLSKRFLRKSKPTTPIISQDIRRHIEKIIRPNLTHFESLMGLKLPKEYYDFEQL